MHSMSMIQKCIFQKVRFCIVYTKKANKDKWTSNQWLCIFIWSLSLIYFIQVKSFFWLVHIRFYLFNWIFCITRFKLKSSFCSFSRASLGSIPYKIFNISCALCTNLLFSGLQICRKKMKILTLTNFCNNWAINCYLVTYWKI